MTFKALDFLHTAFGGGSHHHHHHPQYVPHHPSIDRGHGGGHSDHGWHGSGKGKGGGGGGGNSGAALSALTLLAFLFLINIMQQSLMENNATETTTATTIFLREDQRPIALTSRHDEDQGRVEERERPMDTESETEASYVKIGKSSDT